MSVGATSGREEMISNNNYLFSRRVAIARLIQLLTKKVTIKQWNTIIVIYRQQSSKILTIATVTNFIDKIIILFC